VKVIELMCRRPARDGRRGISMGGQRNPALDLGTVKMFGL
jgi:hypothetical protein